MFSSASKWTEKPQDTNPILGGETEALLQSEHPVKLPHLDVKDMARQTDLDADEIKEIVTGTSAPKLSTKALADSVLFDLSDEDRDALERMNKLG